MIGMLNSGAGGDPNAPTAPWGRDDSTSARGNMWGDTIGDGFGAGGLGMTGIGEGGGGRGEGAGVGLGPIGTIGHGAGTGTGQGFGSGHGRLGGAHRSAPPSVEAPAGVVVLPSAPAPSVAAMAQAGAASLADRDDGHDDAGRTRRLQGQPAG